nr:PREDICTED: KN motif and ankyrin repeat domain-containing protein 4 isoform X1 [Lepisosteus oculatus]XP_015211147.1 PREDICTED: KN motif and ankyrin repeat domain-containing protein 4 isoform X1 [Lepisosteus oculatus]XP_015211148.1 PREDICTED: KN motif and ankyrin repeat domain-containing protein 4 isoform X1 [Lepisosteus oculatus]
MNKSNANGLSSKPCESGGQRKQLPYSVETPYGFHLDLDFLKYVDDIEKGNTIKRVHIHRRAKDPKFSTLPRNFSLPDHGSRSAPKDSWNTPGSYLPKNKSRALDVQQIFDFRAAESMTPESPRALGFSFSSVKAFDEQPLGFRVRPQLLRTSSLPVTVLQRKNSEPSEDQAPPPIRSSNKPNGTSENSFWSLNASPSPDNKHQLTAQKEMSSLHQQFTNALQRVKELEEQARMIPELKEQICSLREEKYQLILKLPPQSAVATEEKTLHSEHERRNGQSQCKELPEGLNNTPASQLSAQCMSASADKLRDTQDTQKTVKALASPSVQNVGVGVTEKDLGLTSEQVSSDTGPLTIIALRTKLTVVEKQLNDTTKELDKVNSLLKEQMKENVRKEERIKILTEEAEARANLKEAKVLQRAADTVETKLDSDCVCLCDAAVGMATKEEGNIFCDKGVMTDGIFQQGACENLTETQPKDLRSSKNQTDCVSTNEVHVSVKVLTEDKSVEAVVSTCDKAVETAQLVTACPNTAQEDPPIDCTHKEPEVPLEYTSNGNQLSPISVCKDGVGCVAEQMQEWQKEGTDESGSKALHQQETDESTSSQAALGHYVTRIQELLHEQWACLENGHPELASTLRQPASKISSIQNQLVSSLNVLSSMYSSQVHKEESSRDSQQEGCSPPSALKSIMKKKDCSVRLGSSGAKKNLKFVGVNGGYETTSSEESSGEDEENDSSEEREDGGVEAAQSTNSEESERTGGHSQVTSESSNMPQPEAASRETVDEDFMAACLFLKDHLSEVISPSRELRQVLSVVYYEWFRVSSQKASQAHALALYLQELKAVSPEVLEFVINSADGNGNTALHYSVSHSNFRIVKLLLDTGLCKVDHQNKAGYTAIMLASLTAADSREDMDVALQLLKQGDINTRASQAGQTALMLAVSHGRIDMVRLLLSCNADVNAQDDDGSTALMCACEHGHADIVRLLLALPACDASITDNEGNSALSIALEASHTEIVDLLKAHTDHGTPDTS